MTTEPPSVQLTPEEVEAFEARREETKKKLAEYAEKLDKEVRLLAERRVSVSTVGPGRVAAVVAGDSGDHRVEWTDELGWLCDCEAFRYRRSCSHLRAVSAVVRLETTEEER